MQVFVEYRQIASSCFGEKIREKKVQASAM